MLPMGGPSTQFEHLKLLWYEVEGPMNLISLHSHARHAHVVACQIRFGKSQGECHQFCVLAIFVRLLFMLFMYSQ